MNLNDLGIKLSSKPKKIENKEIIVTAYFKKVLGTNKKAQPTVENYPWYHKNKYREWITGAKTEENRNKRMATDIEWIAEGKSRHLKYATK